LREGGLWAGEWKLRHAAGDDDELKGRRLLGRVGNASLDLGISQFPEREAA